MWRKVSTNPKVRCEDGDPFLLLVQRILDLIADTSQDLLNQKLIGPANQFFNGIKVFGKRLFPQRQSGNPIPRVCFDVSYDPYKCMWGGITNYEAMRLAQCEDSRFGLEEMCYYARVRQICSSNEMVNEYTEIFAQGYKTVDEVEQEFADAFGESYRFIDPTMEELMRQVEISSFSGPDLTDRKDICSSNVFASAMSLDMIIVSCIFATMEKACPEDAEADESFQYLVD